MFDNNGSVLAIILAAGKGSRMKTALPKVMHKIGSQTLLHHVIGSAQKVARNVKIALVLSPQMASIAQEYKDSSKEIHIMWQEEQKGTAHAVLAARNLLQDFTGNVLIMLGDVPFIEPSTLKRMLLRLEENPDIAAVVLAMECQVPNPYGRLVVDDTGVLQEIVEVKDATPAESEITLCNSGFFAIRGKHLLHLLEKVQPSPVTGEYYLTDIIANAQAEGLKTAYVETCEAEVQGINTQNDLAQAEKYFQDQARQNFMRNGVTLIDPSSVYFSYDTFIAPDVTIYPNVYLGSGVRIETRVEILPFSHIEGAHIHTGAKIGPFARIRPATIINTGSRIGNFVEVKNTTVGAYSKLNHLSYVGDCRIGTQCNIGAGAITVNYDGVQKWPTTIENGVFIGSNSSLIAPLTIAEGAIVAAGSTVTRDVPKDALVFGRARQAEIVQGARRVRQKARIRKSGN